MHRLIQPHPELLRFAPVLPGESMCGIRHPPAVAEGCRPLYAASTTAVSVSPSGRSS